MKDGVLSGLRVVEMAGIGPGPFVGMLLADMGADVLVIERPAVQRSLGGGGAMNRGKRSVCFDLKTPIGLQAATALIARADALIEGYRPGVMERLGLGPAAFEAANPKLIYGRVTGWGQTGPLSAAAGHDINYVALTGALSIATRAGTAPSLPATLLGDMAGGGMFLAFGIVCALLESQRSGCGQVVDAAMVDGVSLLTSLVHSLRATGQWSDNASRNVFLHESPFYDSFECADGQFITLGAIEPKFYAELLQRLDLTDVDPAQQHDTQHWPAVRARLMARIKQQTRDQWTAQLSGTDVCFAPMLNLAEAPAHPHHVARGNFAEVEGQIQPTAAPRFSRSMVRAPQAAPVPGEHTQQVLAELGLAAAPKQR